MQDLVEGFDAGDFSVPEMVAESAKIHQEADHSWMIEHAPEFVVRASYCVAGLPDLVGKPASVERRAVSFYHEVLDRGDESLFWRAEELRLVRIFRQAFAHFLRTFR